MDPTAGEIKSSLSGHSGWVCSVAWSPDGTKLASGSNDETVRIWEAATGKQLCQLKVDYVVLCLTYSPNGDVLAVGDMGGNINFFNSHGEKLQSPVRGHNNVVSSLAFKPDDPNVLITGSWDKTVRYV